MKLDEQIITKKEEYANLMARLAILDQEITKMTTERSNLSVKIIKLDGWLECAKLRG